jgi:hypothetical protein
MGDDIEERSGGPPAANRLRSLATGLDDAYPSGRLAGFSVADGRLVGILSADPDPLRAVIVGGLIDGAPRVRWAVVEGRLTPGRGSVTFRAAALLDGARGAIDLARSRRDHLIIRTGDAGADRLLDAIAPLLVDLLDDLSARQRTVARLLLVDGLRQADAADTLAVSRATVSVMVGRGRIRSIERLADAIRAVMGAARLALAESE